MKLGFSLILSLKTLYHNKQRVFFILFGIIMALSLLFANSVWEDTSENLVIDDFVDNIDYLTSTSSFLIGGNPVIGEYLVNESLVEHVDISILSNVIFNVGNKTGEYRYFPETNQQNNEDPVASRPAMLYNLDAMDNLANVLNVTGRMPAASDEMIIADDLVPMLEKLLETEIKPGVRIDVDIGKRFPFTDNGEDQLKHFDTDKFDDVLITGLYESNGAQNIAEQAFRPGIFDSTIIFPITPETLDANDLLLMDSRSLIGNFMLEINHAELQEAGIDGMNELVFTLLERLRSRFYFLTSQTLYDAMQSIKSEFQFSFNSSLLYYPVIAMSLILTHYALGLLLQSREDQIKILRTRGSTDLDLVQIFSIEFFLIGIVGFSIGIPLAILLSTVIPAINEDTVIDMDLAQLFYKNLELNPSELYSISSIVFYLFLASMSYHIINTVYEPEIKVGRYDLLLIIRVVLTLAIMGGFVFIYQEVEGLFGFSPRVFSRAEQNQYQQSIILLVVLWVLLAQLFSDLVVVILAKLSKFTSKLSASGYFLSKSLNRKNLKLKLTTFYIIFLFSVLIFSSVLVDTYNTYDQQSDEFYQGADLRIHTNGSTFANYSTILEDVEGINSATPIYKTTVYVASQEYSLYAVDPEVYLQIGYWSYANGSAPPSELLSTINSNRSSVLISQEVSNRLNFKVEEEMNINGIEGTYIKRFNITGILNSAPALGLAAHANEEVSQNTKGWLMTSLAFMEDNYEMDYTTVFLANYEDNVDHSDVKRRLLNLDGVKLVNPDPINQNFVGVFISKYLPVPQTILIFVFVLTAVLSILLLSLSTNFLLSQRRREYALMIAIGGTKKKVYRLIYYEFIFLTMAGIVAGLIFGILLSYFSLQFFIPFTLKKVVIPLVFKINIPILIAISLSFVLTVAGIIVVNRRQLFPDNIANVILERES